MVSFIVSSPALDLSALPAPIVVPEISYEERKAGKLARLIELLPAFTALVESDSAVKLIGADAYDEDVLVHAVNDALKQMLLAFAEGSNLDHLGALMDVVRQTLAPETETTPAVLESDQAYRQRIQMAPHSFSVAGPEMAYVYHARSAHSDVADATAVSPAPCEVVVTVLSRSGNGVPDANVISAVDAVLQGPVRPLCDFVTVQAAEPVSFAIEAKLWVYAGPDQGLILDAALKALNAHLGEMRKLGRDVIRSAIISALHVGNVHRVELIQPTADLAIGQHQVANPTSSSVTVAGGVL